MYSRLPTLGVMSFNLLVNQLGVLPEVKKDEIYKQIDQKCFYFFSGTLLVEFIGMSQNTLILIALCVHLPSLNGLTTLRIICSD